MEVIGNVNSIEEAIQTLMQGVERKVNKRIFTTCVLNSFEKGFELLIVFEDKSTLLALITMYKEQGKYHCRVQANFDREPGDKET